MSRVEWLLALSWKFDHSEHLMKDTDHERVSLIIQAWKVWTGKWQLVMLPGTEQSLAPLDLPNQDHTIYFPFIFVTWLLINFNLFQHLPHCLSGNNKSSSSRSIIWERGWYSPPIMENTRGWSLSDIFQSRWSLTKLFPSKKFLIFSLTNQKFEPETHRR